MHDIQKEPQKQGPGFIKQSRGTEVDELMRFPFAFLLLTQIARRARRTTQTFNPHDLKPGEALIGDHQSIGASLQNYRTAKEQLARWKLATFQPTSRGTIATLIDTRVYDINAEQSNNPANNRAPSSSTQKPPPPVTTKKKPRSEEVKKREEEVFDEEERATKAVRRTGDDWEFYFSKDASAIIDQYYTLCVPRGWLPVNDDLDELSDVLNDLQDHDINWFKEIFKEAAQNRDAGDPEYNGSDGNELIRILHRQRSQ